MVVPPNHPFELRIFHYKPSSFLGKMGLRRGGQLSMLFYVDLALRHSLHGQNFRLRCWWSLGHPFFGGYPAW